MGAHDYSNMSSIHHQYQSRPPGQSHPSMYGAGQPVRALTVTLRYRRTCYPSEIVYVGISPQDTSAPSSPSTPSPAVFAIFGDTQSSQQSWIDVFDLSSQRHHCRISGSHATFAPSTSSSSSSSQSNYYNNVPHSPTPGPASPSSVISPSPVTATAVPATTRLAVVRDWTARLGAGVELHHSSSVLLHDYAAGGGRKIGELIDARDSPLAWSPDGRLVAAAESPADCDCRFNVGVWDARTGERLGRVVSHIAPVTHAAFMADGQRLVTLSRDATLRISNPFTSKTLRRLDLSATTTTNAAHIGMGSPPGGSPVMTPALLANAAAATTATISTPSGPPRVLSVSPSGSVIVCVWGTTLIHWVSATDHITMYSLSAVRHVEGWPLCASPDGRLLACRTEEGFDIMDVVSGVVVFAKEGEEGAAGMCTAGVFSVDGKVLILGRMDGTVEVWDIASQRY